MSPCKLSTWLALQHLQCQLVDSALAMMQPQAGILTMHAVCKPCSVLLAAAAKRLHQPLDYCGLQNTCQGAYANYNSHADCLQV